MIRTVTPVLLGTSVALCLILGAASAQTGIERGNGLTHQPANEIRPAMTAEAWTVTSADTVFEEYLGRPSLRLRTGQAHVNDVEFENGTIEFDFAAPDQRSFMGVIFHVEDTGNLEEVYFRPHKSGLWDSTQYQSFMNESSTWQLYQGEGFNAATPIPHDEWIHVRLVVEGARLEVYAGDAEEPILVQNDLKRGPGGGGVGFNSFFPTKDANPDVYVGNFSNLVIRPDDASYEFPAPQPPAAETGYIAHWSTSEPFETPEGGLLAAPSEAELDALAWKTIDAEPSGLINLNRHYPVAGAKGSLTSGGTTSLWARVTLHAHHAQTRRLHFGYSDKLTVLLNGRPIFAGDNSFRTRDQSHLGGVQDRADSVFLDLAEGDNELLLGVSDARMGWGFIARLDAIDGIEARMD